MKIFFRFIPLSGLLLGILLAAQAHSVWIEDVKGKLVIHFGDFGGDLEESPGHLDELSVPTAWMEGVGGTNKLFKIKTRHDDFLMNRAVITQSAFAQTDFEVLSAADKPGRWPIFYARWYVHNSGAAKPMLTFDLVPTGIAGEIKVYFHNKPLPEAKVTVTGPDGKETDLTADAGGIVRFTADKSGLYFATSIHQRDTIPGYSRGKSYDLISHNCSLCWRQ